MSSFEVLCRTGLTSKLHDLVYQSKWFTRHNGTSMEFQLEMARLIRLFYAGCMQELNRSEEAGPSDIEDFGATRYFDRDNKGNLTPKGEREKNILQYASSRPPLVMRWPGPHEPPTVS